MCRRSSHSHAQSGFYSCFIYSNMILHFFLAHAENSSNCPKQNAHSVRFGWMSRVKKLRAPVNEGLEEYYLDSIEWRHFLCFGPVNFYGVTQWEKPSKLKISLKHYLEDKFWHWALCSGNMCIGLVRGGEHFFPQGFNWTQVIACMFECSACSFDPRIRWSSVFYTQKKYRIMFKLNEIIKMAP